MKLSSWVLLVFSVAAAGSCFQPPDYPSRPEIEFEGVYYDDGQFEDAIVVSFKFKDGDGDLGLGASESETLPPFNERWYYSSVPFQLEGCKDSNRCHYLPNPVTQAAEFAKVIKYKTKRLNMPGADTLKPFVKPYWCTRWEVVTDETEKTIDTVYYLANPHYNNIFITFQVKNGNDYIDFDDGVLLNFPECVDLAYNSRIPLLRGSEPGAPLEGRISYAIKSVDFKVLFGAKLLRLKFYIEDRALNRSNVVITDDFTLTGN